MRRIPDAIRRSRRQGFPECLEACVDAGGDPAYVGATRYTLVAHPLTVAARSAHWFHFTKCKSLKIAWFLVVADDRGWTPLHRAAWNCHVACLRALLQRHKVSHDEVTRQGAWTAATTGSCSPVCCLPTPFCPTQAGGRSTRRRGSAQWRRSMSSSQREQRWTRRARARAQASCALALLGRSAPAFTLHP